MNDSRKLLLSLGTATVLWTLMFAPVTAPHLHFWVMMTLSATVLTTLAVTFRPAVLRELRPTATDVVLGIAIAAALWSIFWVGDKAAAWLFHFARPQVESIYDIKHGTSPALLSALLLLWIGPAEEIFWRGYAQHTLSRRLGANLGAIACTAVYALVHAPSCNFMLLMAALVAGVVWGALYRFFPRRFPAIIISHALWDAAVFVWFPI